MADKRTSPLVSSSPSLGQLHDLEAARKELKRKMVALLAEEKAAKRARAKLLARARCLSEGDLVLLLSEKRQPRQQASTQTEEQVADHGQG